MRTRGGLRCLKVPQVVIAEALRESLDLLACRTHGAFECPRAELAAVSAGQQRLAWPPLHVRGQLQCCLTPEKSRTGHL